MIVLGIDPGITGAVAAIESGVFVGVCDLPLMVQGKLTWIDSMRLMSIMRTLCESVSSAYAPARVRAFVERTHAMPKMGVVAANSKGLTLGSILAALQIWGASIELVSPQAWKRHFTLINADWSDRQRKDASLSRARLMFPTAELDRKKDHNRAEALLIAAYGERVSAQRVAA